MRPSSALNVLVVGGPHGLAESLAPPLREDGHRVGEAADGDRAVAVSREEFPDVVFLDVDAVGPDTPNVAERIGDLSARRRPFMIALSAAPPAQCPPSPYRSPIDLHLIKPSDFSSLRHLLRRFQAIAKDFESFDPAI
jgi:CheY-like chemotaxis protein